MRRRISTLGLILAMVWSGTASAQAQTPATDTAPPSSVDDITVVGAASHRTLSAYTRAVGTGPAGRLNPRWRNRLCVRVVNMSPEHAAYMRTRIEQVAEAVGLTPDRSADCRPDVSVYATDDPQALATALVSASPRSFRPGGHGVSLGDAALRAFRTSDAPVRWWQVSLPVMDDSGQPAIALGGETGGSRDAMARSVTVRNGSRLSGHVRDDLMAVTVIVDIGQVTAQKFEAVSDYVAFVALAPADPRVDTAAFDTVLNLFDAPDVTGLTLMDEDYLFALYAASRTPATVALQDAEIAGRMAVQRRRRAEGRD